MAVVDISNTYQLTNVGAHIDNTDVYNSNRNLLDNPFFTIRQMGTGGVTGVGYAVDRWKNTGGAGLTQTPRSPYGITFASSSGYQVDQALWDYPAEYLVGKTFTLSIMTSGGNIAQATGIFTAASSTAAKVAVTSADGNFTVGLYYNTSARAIPFVRITTPSGRFPVNAAILAVKLELGSYSTLANDVPPDYYDELDHCKWYFERIKAGNTYADFGIGVALSTTNAAFLVNMHPKRNNQYTVVTSGVFGTTPGGTINSLVVDRAASNGVLNLYATGTFVANSLYVLRSVNDANVYIDINNDL